MALSLQKLQLELTKLLDTAHPEFAGFSKAPDPATAALETATKWADVLFGYWMDAQTLASQCPLEVVTFLAKKPAFIASLSTVFVPVGTSASVAAGFESAFQTLWLGQLFVPVPPVTIAVTTPGTPVASTLLNALTPLFSEYASLAAAKASQLASAFELATRTVTITTTVPPGPPVIEPIL